MLFVGLLWLVFAARALFPALSWHSYGIVPRSLIGIPGIVLAPILHANLYHVAANTVPIFVLMLLLQLQAGRKWPQPLMMVWLLSGAGTWVIGRGDAVHLGASGVIYGLLTYLISAGIYHRDWKSMLIAGLVFLGYGSLLWKIFPMYWFISWESHLCGAIAGVFVASLTRPRSS